jgi:Cell division protein FtsI/penicillin-binding protein 2
LLDTFLEWLKKTVKSRLFPVIMIYTLLLFVLVNRIFSLQIVEGEAYVKESMNNTTDKRELKSTRGRICDYKGKVLAYNELSYSVTLEDIGELTDNESKNAMIHNLIQIIEKNDGNIVNDFYLQMDDDGNIKYNIKGKAIERFKKDIFSVPYANKLSKKQESMTAEDIFNYLRNDKSTNSSSFQIGNKYSKEEALKIMAIRFSLFMNRYSKYMPITVANRVAEKTVAAIKEDSADLPGVEISQETHRVYNDSKYFAQILGYTGLINSDQLKQLQDSKNEDYSATNQIGKTGLEKQYEKYLHGKNGYEEVLLNESRRVVKIAKRVEPVAGNDLYLTIDADLQKSCYDMLERKLASILLSNIVNSTSVGSKGKSSDDIKIPIYDVYYSLIKNNVIDISKFNNKDATPLEKQVYQKYLDKRKSVYNQLDTILAVNSNTTKSSASKEMQEYLSYIYSALCKKDILKNSQIKTDDEQYIAYQDGKISLSKFLQYAISNNWVDLSKLNVGNEYYSTTELYNKLIAYTKEILKNDSDFNKNLYHSLIYSYNLTGTQICLLLFDQGVLKYNETDMNSLKNGTISAYSFMMQKIKKLEITPGQLALDPCSGSVVVTDVNTGQVRALVTYPGYDNNKMANSIDYNYYNYLENSQSFPFMNRATQQMNAPGSTYKMVASTAALEEGVVGPNETVYDAIKFTKISNGPKDWSKSSHGNVDVPNALKVSCDYFFYEMGWRLSMTPSNTYDSNLGLKKLKKYATMFGLNALSGVELSEYKPHVSDNDSIRSSIGQGTNNFAPVQLSRYVSTIANSGTCYNLTIIDKIKDISNKIIVQKKSSVFNKVNLKQSTWNDLHEGMYLVVNSPDYTVHTLFDGFTKKIAGKTGTAQLTKLRPNHALFVSYAPYDSPEISVTVVIPNGYTSHNAAEVASNVYKYYFKEGDQKSLDKGDVTAAASNGGRTD